MSVKGNYCKENVNNTGLNSGQTKYALTQCVIQLVKIMGARRNFSRGGQSRRHFKKSTRFRRAVQKIDHFSARRRRKRKFLRFLRRFRLKYRVSIASAEGASENFRVFCRTAAYDVIFSNSRGGQVPPLAPPPCGRPWFVGYLVYWNCAMITGARE